MSVPDFSAANALLQRQVDGQLLSGVSTAVWRDGVLVDTFCTGLADIEQAQPLTPQHIHRAYSNTKLVVSVLALTLVDQGRLALDAPVSQWLPRFASLRVLRAGARTLDDTEPLARPVTLRHLLSHQAGLAHGVFDPGSLLYQAYHARGVRRPDTTLAELMDILAGLPLNFQPGEGWDYSLAPDVLGRVIELATGQSLGDALQTRLLQPLGMVDTGFVLTDLQRPRLAAQYIGDLAYPAKPGLTRADHLPWPGAYLQPVPRQSGAGGLFTTQADMLALLGQLVPGRPGLLSPALQAEMTRDQLPPGRRVNFPNLAVPDLGFSLVGAVARPGPTTPTGAVGELQWGGLAGTHWWLHPGQRVMGVLMTQRFMGFWNPFWWAYRQAVYDALAAARRGAAR
jgi:CubicO group peptidase (beta-lactamase class C family)